MHMASDGYTDQNRPDKHDIPYERKTECTVKWGFEKSRLWARELDKNDPALLLCHDR